MKYIQNTSTFWGAKTILSDLYGWNEAITTDNWRRLDSMIRERAGDCGWHHQILDRSKISRTGRGISRRTARKLWNEHRDTVIVTCGVEGCWVLNADHEEHVHYSAFQVEGVDTTGCGDVFHGAYAAALVKGLGIRRAGAVCFGGDGD